MIQTVFLDAGGVLVNPNFDRVAEALSRRGVEVSGEDLRTVEPMAKRDLEDPAFIKSSDDDSRGLVYFATVLRRAGIAIDDRVREALTELRTYHAAHNLWESVPDDVRPFLVRLRDRGLRRVVVSNANGTLHAHFDRLGLTSDISSKLLLMPPGNPSPTIEAVLKGRAEIGFSQMSEILASPDVDALGPLPVDIQNFTTFTAAIPTQAKQAAAANELIVFLRTPRAIAVLTSKGIDTD